MGYNLFPWLNLTNAVRIHPLTMGNDAYEITDEAIKEVRSKKKTNIIEVVETPEMDISDCTGGFEGAKVKVYLIKCRDSVWVDFSNTIRKLAKENDIPMADLTLT